MSKLPQLKSQRSISFNRLLETKEIAQKALEDTSLHSFLKVRSKYVESYFTDFMTNHVQVVNAVKDVDLETEDDIRKQADEAFFYITSIADTLFPPATPSVANTTLSKSQQNIKLPKIDLPHFDGNFKLWGTFRDMFNTLINNNPSLSNIEKFQYLIASLSKTPLSIVSNLPVTNENYPIAYKSLIDRYQNKRSLATSHWREIQKLANLSSDAPQGLRHLLDTFSENMAALKLLGFPVDQWDFVVFNLLLDKVDLETRKSFEKEHSTIQLPSFHDLKTFLSNLCEALERASLAVSKFSSSNTSKRIFEKPIINKPKSAFVINRVETSRSSNRSCILCKDNHALSKCPEFLKKTPYDRYLVVKERKLCLNCISPSHVQKNCPSSFACRICRAPHHSLLHFNSKSLEPSSLIPANLQNRGPSGSQTMVTSLEPNSSAHSSAIIVPCNSQTTLTSTICNRATTLLSTALIEIIDAWGNSRIVRALLDSASQASFLTEKCARRLGVPRSKSFIPIQGVGQISSSASRGTVNCEIRSQIQNFSCVVEFVILDKICGDMPNINIDSANWEYIGNLQLADPNFGTPEKIDALLGADIFPDLLQTGKIIGNSTQPTAINTVFGWVLMGPVSSKMPSTTSSFLISLNSSIDLTLKKFWELEEVPNCSPLSPDDVSCEDIYQNSYTRTAPGRFTVSLPFKGPEPVFPETRSLALRRFNFLERRLLQNPVLRNLYSQFMREYLDSGHMELIANPNFHEKTFYIPHHCVWKPESNTSKLRVVFDASAKPPNATSLNDHLLIGPKLQKDIVTILLNFRLHLIAFTADIKQMYRQILVSPSHCDYQRIVWRFDPKEPVQDYKLKTVTYGVSSAPFLALRTIHQLAIDEANSFPLASKVLQTDIYVDDIVTGSDSLDQALNLQQQLNDVFKKGGFELRKWASNHPELLATLPAAYCQTPLSFDSDPNIAVKILGLQWSPAQDSFSYKIDIRSQRICSKRVILSELAKTFDPLGFLSPLTFFAKHLIQHLWCLGLDWDATPPAEVSERWDQYQSQLPQISKIQIPRRIRADSPNSCELHGFCDASELGYAAVVYIRFVTEDSVTISLVCAKSKVAPLKRVSIPRLELCAAHLLANLMSFVIQNYSNQLIINRIFAWSDSTIVLSWLNSSPHRWKTFVSNRVSYIQDKIPSRSWHHVRSADNPADCASRGLLPNDLLNHPLWWNGPLWLNSSEDSWPVSDCRTTSLEGSSSILEEERKLTLTTIVSPELFNHLLSRYSSLQKLQRIVAYCLRYINNSRHPPNKRIGALSSSELQQALLLLVKRVQHLAFQDDIGNLRSQRTCSKPLRKLNPFLDDGGLLRVGGRLSYSSLSYDQKHPVLLPGNNRLTELIIEDTHRRYLHPGSKTLQFLLIQNYWIVSAKRSIRRCLSNCYRCFRTKPPRLEPFMADLPPVRVNQVKPFSSVGVDYGGPFTITMAKTRGAKTLKAYLCLFVCLTTKAVHLELASDLSTEAFLAALRRFISRRGRCSHIYSDCGTNFVGAQRQLQSFMKQAVESEIIEWHFNPPSAPHFGGIWEAGIKSVKSHLSRVVGDQTLTYEELNTVFTLIESVLNSRPLCEVSSDPNDFSALTPGHFLTLEPLSTIPDPDLTNVKMNRLNRWQLIQRFHQDFWKRWHREYLHTLQQRSKWNKISSPLSPGMIVLVVDDTAPPMQWRLARVEKLHPGPDGICRVVTIKTKQGLMQRPVVKICPLPPTQ